MPTARGRRIVSPRRDARPARPPTGLGELAKDPSVIALSLPIDYWDYLGWKTRWRIRASRRRQKAYSRARGDREVYTPQAVVNGGART